MMTEWPNTPAAFRALYQQHMAEYETLRKRPPWDRSAALDDRLDALRRKLVCMEKDACVRDLPRVA